MPGILKLPVLISCIVLSFAAVAQPAKPKQPAKPAAKPAAAVKKIDYEKMKQDIRNLYRNEKHKELIAKAAQYLAKFPKDTAVTMQKAVSHVALKQNQTGFALVRKFFPDADTAAKYTAIMAFSMPEKDLQEAGIACTDEAIKIAPANPWGYFVKGGIYSDLKEHEKALPLLEEMNRRLSNEGDRQLLGHFYAKELAITKQLDKAVVVIDALYKSFPADEEILSTYGYVYRYNKIYDKAIVKYDELIKLSPDNINYRLWKASALGESGDVAGACGISETIIAKDEAYDFLRFKYKCPAYFAAPAVADIKTAVWNVNFSGTDYDFTVSSVKGSTDTDFEFDWAMSSSSDMNGHIKITQSAMEKAFVQNNRFGPSNKNAVLEDKTTVWVSKAVINDLINKGTAKMDVESGEEEFTVVPNTAELRDEEVFETKIKVKGEDKYLNTLHVKNAEGSRHLWILNDPKNPLIVKMQLDWSITLKSIE
jgi:tetratricopeptide (TPR) repeat protein